MLMRGLEACVGCWAVLFPNACRTRESIAKGAERRERLLEQRQGNGDGGFPEVPTYQGPLGHWS